MNPDTATALAEPPTPWAIDTCHSTWLFDEQNHRFRRILRHRLVRDVSTDWRSYERLVVDPSRDAFVVILEPDGTRILRGHRCAGSDCSCRTSPDASRLSSLRATPAPAVVAAATGWASGGVATGVDGARIIPLPRSAPKGSRSHLARPVAPTTGRPRPRRAG